MADAVAVRPVDAWPAASGSTGNTYANLGENAITTASAARLRVRWQVSDGSSFVPPAVVGGIAYRTVFSGNASTPSTLVATSVRTGATRWRLTLPEAQYFRGASVSHGIAVLPFEGFHLLGGITAVDLASHKVLWSRTRPASTRNPRNDDGTNGPVAIAGGRVFLLSGNNVLSAYELRSGALQWHINPAAGIKGFAAGAHHLFTGGYPSEAGPGLVAYDAASGARSWSTPGLFGQPVIVGATVLAATYQGVGSARAGGCAARSCPPTWTRDFAAEPISILIGAASSTSFFVTYEPGKDRSGRIARVGTQTGELQWIYGTRHSFDQFPIRAGGIVWARTTSRTIKGWSVNATGPAVLRTVTLPYDHAGVVGGLADADGSLLVHVFAGALTAYRVAGT